MAKEGYVQQKKRSGIGSWIGWGVTTLLLFFLNRNSNGSDTSSQQPTEFKEDNVNCIGQPVPVVLGRSLIKNPLISYYGDFGYEPYTEEYGMHSGIDVWGFLLPLLLSLLNALMQPDRVEIPGGGEPSIADKIVREAQKAGEKTAKTAAEAAGASAVPTGTIPPVISKPNVSTIETVPNGHPIHNHEVTGYIEFNSTGQKAWSVAGFVISVILWLLSMLFGSHLGRTTIQKGFLYYLGWQHIICWTGRNIGIGDIYMNEYLLEPEKEIQDDKSIKVYDDMGINLNTAVVISTTLYNYGSMGVRPLMQFGGNQIYYDINSYATSSDKEFLRNNDEYADNEATLLDMIENSTTADGTKCDSCIIVLQGVGPSAFSWDFYNKIIESGMPLVVWQLDMLNLNSDFSMSDFTYAMSAESSTTSDEKMVNSMCSFEKVYYIDGRDFAFNYLRLGFRNEGGSGSIADKYKRYGLSGNHYISGGGQFFVDTPVRCPLEMTWTLIHFIELAHIDYDYPLNIKKLNKGSRWEKYSMAGTSFFKDDKELFGGWDEGGGFTGELRFYFGNRVQPKDPWMIHSMNQDTIEESLRGLTPQYPMYVTCVISNKDKNGGAYIGKQATIPEMWFEIFNYPSRISDYNSTLLLEKFCESLEKEYKKADDYIKAQDGEVQDYMESKMDAIRENLDSYQDSAKAYMELPRWKGKTKYDVGMIAMFNDIVYECVETHISTTFSADLASGYWEEQSNELKPWKPNTKFSKDDLVLRNGEIYKCTETFYTANSFTERNFDLQKKQAPYPSIDYLHNTLKTIEEAIDYFPPTNRKLFAETLEGLRKMCTNGVWHLGRLGDDANPAEAIYEILVNSYWGCDYLEDKIDISSLIDIGVKCEEEGLGVSCLINRTAQANDYVSKILSHINGVKYDDPTTGKLTFKLIRNDYDVNSIKVFDTTNTESCEFSRLDWSETTSAVDVTFTDASNKYDTGQFTFNDISNRLITGFYASKSVEGEYFTTTENAMWLAKLTQLSNGYPLSAVNLTTNRYAYDVTIGDPIKVTWQPYGLSQVVYRITDIDYANLTDGKISITAIEDVFGFDKLDFDVSESPQWTDPTDKPGQISRYTFMEEPYETSRSLDSYIFAYAAQPDNNTVYWDVYRKVNGGFIKSVQSMLWSTIGRLTFGCLKEFTIDEVGMEFSILGTGGRELMDAKIEKMEKYPTTYTNVSGLNLVVIDNEWMSYNSIDKLANGHYKIRGVIRGIFDTIPEQHTAESIMYFVEYKLNIVQVGRPVSLEGEEPVTEELEIVSETRNAQQPFDSSRVQTFTTTRRSEQPSIMANMKFGIDMGELTDYEYDYVDGTIFSGDLLYTFIGRNKYDDYGIIEQTNADVAITVANDTMNVIQMYSNGVESEWKTNARDTDAEENVNSMSLKWEQFCEKMGDNLRYKNDVNMKVMTYNSTKDLYSYAHYEETIDWYTPRFVGVVSSEAEAQELANSYMSDEDYHIIVPETSVSLKFGLTFSENPIIIEGTIVTGNTSINDIVGQDGNPYRLSNTAYRIIGKDEEGNAILNPFTIENNYVLRTDFTEKAVNKDKYYKYSGNNWIPFEIYNE